MTGDWPSGFLSSFNAFQWGIRIQTSCEEGTNQTCAIWPERIKSTNYNMRWTAVAGARAGGQSISLRLHFTRA